MATARIVCDFDAGIAAVPFSRDFSTTSFIVPHFYQKMRRIERGFFTLDYG